MECADEVTFTVCDECKEKCSSHRVGNRYMCCACYVKAGNPPADWHSDCMTAHREAK